MEIKNTDYKDWISNEKKYFAKNRKLAKEDPLKYWMGKNWLNNETKKKITELLQGMGRAGQDFRTHPIVAILVYYAWRFPKSSPPVGIEGIKVLRRSNISLRQTLKTIDEAIRELRQVVGPVLNACGPGKYVVKKDKISCFVPGGEYYITPLAQKLQWAYDSFKNILDMKKTGKLNKDIQKKLRGCLTNSTTNLSLCIIKKYFEEKGSRKPWRATLGVAKASGLEPESTDKRMLRDRLKKFDRQNEWEGEPHVEAAYRQFTYAWEEIGWIQRR